MYKFVIVTDSDRASGFRLAGVEVFEAGSNEEAKKVIAPLLYKDDIGIVAVNEEFMLTLDEKMMNRIEKLSAPLSFLFLRNQRRLTGDRISNGSYERQLAITLS